MEACFVVVWLLYGRVCMLQAQHHGSTSSRPQRRDGSLLMVELKPDMSLTLALGVVIDAVDVKHVTDRS